MQTPQPEIERRLSIYNLSTKSKKKPLKEAGGPDWQANLNN